MNLDNDELNATRLQRNKIKYITLLAEGKGLTHEEFKQFYNDYEFIYNRMCYYIDLYRDYTKLTPINLDECINIDLTIQEYKDKAEIQKQVNEMLE